MASSSARVRHVEPVGGFGFVARPHL